MLTQVLSVTLRLLLFRAGPQDFPFAEGLGRATIVAALLANTFLFSMMLPLGLAFVIGIAMIVALGLATRSILRMRKFESRFQQTFNALLATSAALTLAQLPLFAQIAPEMLKLMHELQQAGESGEIVVNAQAAGDLPQIPAFPVFLLNLLSFWNFAVQAHIYRHAAGVNLWIGGLIALIVSMVALGFAVFGGSIIAAVLGLGATT